MSKRKSDKSKKQDMMGTGVGAEYKPYIVISEFNSQGTTAAITDWKTNRVVHCLSQGEKLWYYILRWDDNNIDIREQYPLDAKDVAQIAAANGFRRPHGTMTTDFLVTRSDGSNIAYSVKNDYDLDERTLQKLCIEKKYWNDKKVEFEILFKCDIDDRALTLANNVRLVVEYFDLSRVHDVYSLIKHMIATKQIKCDMYSAVLSTKELLQAYKESRGGIENGRKSISCR